MKRPSYDQFCAVACALDVIGDRWALLIVRELLFGAKRFTDLLEGLPGIGTNTLTSRLSELEANGIVARKRMPPPLVATLVELTERGRALEPVLVALVRWGTPVLMSQQPRHGLRPPWLGLALRTFFDPTGARGPRLTVEVLLPLGSLCLSFGGKEPLHIAEGPPPGDPAALQITTTEPVLLDVLRGAMTVTAARRKHGFKIEGGAELFDRLMAAFPIGARPVPPEA